MSSLWSNSIELMLLGMGTVFIFLSLLIVGVTIMSNILNRFAAPEPIVNKPAITSSSNNSKEVAAVAAAAWATSQHSSN